MNKKAWIGVAIFVVVDLIIVAIWVTRSQEPDIIKIGAILPLTGSAAPYGKNAQNGIEIAVQEINAAGGVNGRKIVVIYEDSMTDPKQAVSALQKLSDADKIRFIIGDINSTGVLAMAPIAERKKILLLSPGASNPKISHAGNYIFRNWHSDALEGQVGAEYAFNKLKWRKVAILYVNAAYGVGLAETFRDKFKNLEGQIVSYEAYPQDATNMREQISKILASKADGIYLPGWPKEMSVALKQLKELGSTLPILSAQGFDDPSILNLAGRAAEGAVFSVPQQPDPNDKTVKGFTEAYQKKYSKEAGVCSAAGYDALRIYIHAIKIAGEDPVKVQKLLAKLENFPGADGPISFDKYGDLLKPFAFKEVQNGKFTAVE